MLPLVISVPLASREDEKEALICSISYFKRGGTQMNRSRSRRVHLYRVDPTRKLALLRKYLPPISSWRILSRVKDGCVN